jgi:hypothetical protein
VVKYAPLLALILTLASCSDEQERIKEVERVEKEVCACQTPACITSAVKRAKKFDEADLSPETKRKMTASFERMEACMTDLEAGDRAGGLIP